MYLLLQFFTRMDTFLKEVSEVHFDKHTGLSSVLTVAIAHRKEVLMESLADVWSQNKVVLVLFVDVMH